MRPSVWVSTADVGSTSTSTSALVRMARARLKRWRCPPEKPRPRSSTVVDESVFERVQHVQ